MKNGNSNIEAISLKEELRETLDMLGAWSMVAFLGAFWLGIRLYEIVRGRPLERIEERSNHW